MVIRLCKIGVLASYTLLLTLIAFGNVTDCGSNWPFVQHVLAMDTTFQNPGVMWRAVTDPTLQTLGYIGIIALETTSALVMISGVIILVGRLRGSAEDFDRAKTIAVVGISLSLILWLGGFLAVGGEWFAMWQSPSWNGAGSAGRFLLAGGITLLFLVQPERDP
ncbi:MAG: hypothetical protein CMM46_00475 [Rhodospirillaceae bacterium]|nr:hypothetical protein [Rhodospirillaceae bacterium]|tara:strand:- start:2684 stop:3175 length:492 start_codon:yes stop_codon:yes gene_type:complete